MNLLRCRAVALIGLTSLFLLACAALPEAPYKLYPGPVQPDSDIAIVRLDDVGAAKFDGRLATQGDWTEVLLLPGEHLIEWQTEFGVVDPNGLPTGGNEAKVVLLAGHVYTLRADLTTGPRYRTFFWIRDDTTQQVIAGTPKP